MNAPARTPGPGPDATPEHPRPGAPPAAAPSADAPRAEAAPVVVEAPSTAELVASAVATWRTTLVEAAGGSTLADVDLLGDVALDLSAAHPSGIAQLFAGRQTRLSNLVREGSSLSTAKRRARVVGARADEYAQRYGIAPTYLAIGVATWVERTAPDVSTDDVAALAAVMRGRPAVATPTDTPAPADTPASASAPRVVRAPVLLRPVALHARGSGESDYELTLEPSIEVNPVLARALRGRGALLDPLAVARGAFTSSGFDPRPALDRLKALGSAVLEDFSLTERLLVGTFVHPGQVLVEDLDQSSATLERHEVVAALAGDGRALAALARPLPEPIRGDRDPAEERGVGDLDPVQRHVLDVLATGSHLFIDAPAGCDVTGTLAAVVADAAARGRSVLYVPGHRRAATSLTARLTELGLDDLLLDVAPDAGWRTAVTRRLLGAMSLQPQPVDTDAVARLRRDLVAQRGRLSGYVTALHERREPWGASAYDALQALARLTSTRPGPQTTVRLGSDVVRVLDARRREQLAERLAAAAALGAFATRPSETPWFGADLTTNEAADDAVARIDRLVGGGLASLAARAEEVAGSTGLTTAQTLAAWGEQLDMLAGIRTALDVFQPLVFERTAADLVAATATKEWRARHDMPMGLLHRRRLTKQAKDMVRPGRPVADLHAALVEVQRQRDIWQAHCPGGGWPRLPHGLSAIEGQYRQVREDLEQLEQVLTTTPGGGNLLRTPFAELQDRLRRLLADRAVLSVLPERTATIRSLRSAGLDPLLTDLANRRVPPELVGAELELAWWSTVFEELLRADPALAGYDGAALSALAAEVRRLDLAHVASLSAPVRTAVVEQVGATLRVRHAQAESLFGELVEERLTSLRDTVERYPELVRRLRPVLTAAPMLVPQLLPPTRTVDLVVLDAVQHLPIELALAALVRGRQVVVVGDARCASGTTVRELAAVLPEVALRADATRRDPYLTAFLAEHGYAGVLEAVPLPEAAPLVRLDVVDGSGMPDGETGAVESTRAEVEHVVELAIEHALTRPEESLAVITSSPVHANRVREAIMTEVRDNPALASFFDPGRAEPFVVADLAGVAGLRREAIIFSLGYGRTPHGRVLHRFGPVSGPGGEALLLDALGATRHRLVLVSCFAAADLDPDRLRGPGARLLADLLEFAAARGRDEAGPAVTAPDVGAATAPDRLVVDLAERLWRAGLVVEIDYGVAGGRRIPLAVGHPDLPGELVVAVLTDDAAYVAEPSVRVRDRQVAQRLERLGWTVVQVWSAAAFLDPQAEADSIQRAVLGRVADRRARGAVPLAPALHGDVPSGPTELSELGDAQGSRGSDSSGGEGDVTAPGAGSEEDAVDGLRVPARRSVVPRARPAAGPGTAAPEPDAGRAAGHEQPTLPVPGRPRPPVERGLPISAYGDDQLDELAEWIMSDGVARQPAELTAALRFELGITRRGARVDAAIDGAVRRALT
ncbi:hypothetical protein [Cellulomonas fimi]|uniref:Restriction endonuclease type II-like domain-containing protein n=1 Tax=Cellulomonas fimi TaxID=1708 RepID=A0A7Y0QHZ8_CELFI|nr:hypothetical protein [Cellulomonas fimi]NMR20673.1 hypothetical protein [Cellulomonas fimi]